MTEQALTVEDDLAYLRRVVDSDRGARVRFKFGVVYLICGLLWGPYALIVWAVNIGLLKMSKETNGLLWLVVMVLFFGGATAAGHATRCRRAHSRPHSPASASVTWSCSRC